MVIENSRLLKRALLFLFKFERKHYGIRRGLSATDRCVHRHGSAIVAFGEDPGFAAPRASRLVQDSLHEGFADALALVCGRDADFVDPELGRRLVRMQVNHRAYKTDDKITVQRDHQTMARVFKEFLSRGFNDGIVKYLSCDVAEDR